MTAIDLDELEKLARAAEPGPWKKVSARIGIPIQGVSGVIVATARTINQDKYKRRPAYEAAHRNADFIAAANPQTVLQLIEALKK